MKRWKGAYMIKEKLQLADMRTEYQKHPLGMDEEHPRFSWKLVSETPDVKQTAYRIIVRCKEEVVWDTEKKAGQESVAVLYAGAPLKPCTEYQVSVQVWDNYDGKRKPLDDSKENNVICS